MKFHLKILCETFVWKYHRRQLSYLCVGNREVQVWQADIDVVRGQAEGVQEICHLCGVTNVEVETPIAGTGANPHK